MIDDHDPADPVHLLGSLAPPAGWNEHTDIATDERAASILERVISGNVVPFRAPRRRLRVVTGVVIAVASVGVAAAAFIDRTPTEARTLTCWSEAVSPPQMQIGVTWDGIGDPVAACTPLWSAGHLGETEPPDALRVCVTGRGVAAVIPGQSNTCGALGFAPYEPSDRGASDSGPNTRQAEDPVAIAAAESLIIQRFGPETCATAEEVGAGVAEIFEELGFVGWAIDVVSTIRAGEPCATAALDSTLRTAIVVSKARAD